jgi:uncharacterized protein (TIGR02588 family)
MSGDHVGEADGRQQKPVTLLEKIATGLSALLVCLLIAVLVRDAAHPDTPPRFAVEPGAITLVGRSNRIPVTVRNLGDKSAKSVVVHVALVSARSDSVVAESDVIIDWLPGRSSRDIVGMLTPSSGSERTNVRVDVRGYAVP